MLAPFLVFGTDIPRREQADRKSTRLNSSHQIISYAVFCLKKKKRNIKNAKYHIVVHRHLMHQSRRWTTAPQATLSAQAVYTHSSQTLCEQRPPSHPHSAL